MTKQYLMATRHAFVHSDQSIELKEKTYNPDDYSGYSAYQIMKENEKFIMKVVVYAHESISSEMVTEIDEQTKFSDKLFAEELSKVKPEFL